MNAFVDRLRLLCTGDPAGIRQAFLPERRWLGFCVAVIVAGSGVYGATIGLGRAPLQAWYTALKFPLLLLLTTAGNALLNGMLAQLLGLVISFRHATLAIVTSFATTSVVLASLSPVTLFLWWSAPPFSSAQAGVAHSATLVIHVILIAFAGTTANIALFCYSSATTQGGDHGTASTVGTEPAAYLDRTAAAHRAARRGQRPYRQ